MKLGDLVDPLARALGDDDRPVAVFAALWPLARALRTPVDQFLGDLHGLLVDALDHRTLTMPAFAGGFVDGHCDLDKEPSRTGVWSEYFRNQPGVIRSVSAFFAFAVDGPCAGEVAALRPSNAWGDGSLYEWLHDRDAQIVTVGVHPTHCSFSHRAEWLARERISYRYDKTFEGEITWQGKRFPHRETLFVRDLDRRATNDFTRFLAAYRDHGMTVDAVDGVHIAGIGARAKMDVLVAALQADPDALIQPTTIS